MFASTFNVVETTEDDWIMADQAHIAPCPLLVDVACQVSNNDLKQSVDLLVHNSKKMLNTFRVTSDMTGSMQRESRRTCEELSAQIKSLSFLATDLEVTEELPTRASFIEKINKYIRKHTKAADDGGWAYIPLLSKESMERLAPNFYHPFPKNNREFVFMDRARFSKFYGTGTSPDDIHTFVTER